MIQCSECEHFHRSDDGRMAFSCDPFSNVKEPECLAKWQLLRLAEVSAKLDKIVHSHEAQSAMYQRLAPLQERMFKHMERELNDADESDKWKVNDDEWDADSEHDEDER